MLDLFTIFSKGGIVLWCFQSTSQIFTPSVNALIKTVLLQVRIIYLTIDFKSLHFIFLETIGTFRFTKCNFLYIKYIRPKESL